MIGLRNLLRRLGRSRSGVAMTEFALGAPFLLTAGLWGTDMANYALVNMKIGQLAFFRLSSPAEHPYGSATYGSHYQGQRGPTASRSFASFHRADV